MVKDKFQILLVILFSLFAALYYQVAWQYPIVDAFPLVERLLDKNYNLSDFYTNTFSDYSPRLYVAHFFILGSKIFGVHYTEFVAYANIVRIFITFVALYYLYLGLSKDRTIALFALFLSALSFLAVPKMVAWWPLTYDLTGSSIAACALMVAWGLFAYQRLLLACLGVSVAVFFHPVVGVHGSLVALLIYYSVAEKDKFFAPLTDFKVHIGITFIVIAFLLNLIPYVNSLSGFKLESQRFIEINANFKHAHHYLASHFDWQNWLSFAIYFLVFLYIWKKYTLDQCINKFVNAVVYYSLFMMLAGWLFLEVVPLKLTVTFIPYRAYAILIPAFVLVFAVYAYEKYKAKDYLSALSVCLIFIPYKSLGFTWYFFPDFHSQFLPTLVFVLVLLYAELLAGKLKLHTAINQWLGCAVSSDKLLVSTMVLAVVMLIYSLLKFSITIPTLSNSAKIYDWLHVNTQTTSLIVAELNAADNQKIRLLSRRAVVASKDFPFLEKYYEEWYQRYVDVYIHQYEARGRIDKLNAAELNKIMDKHRAGILIRTKELEPNKFFTLLASVPGERSLAYIYNNNNLDK